jgi:hypothetical protein
MTRIAFRSRQKSDRLRRARYDIIAALRCRLLRFAPMQRQGDAWDGARDHGCVFPLRMRFGPPVGRRARPKQLPGRIAVGG